MRFYKYFIISPQKTSNSEIERDQKMCQGLEDIPMSDEVTESDYGDRSQLESLTIQNQITPFPGHDPG